MTTVAFLEATAVADQASAVPATGSTAATGKAMTAAECTAERLGATIASSAIREPVRNVTSSAPSWVEPANGIAAHCRVNGSIAPVDTHGTATDAEGYALPDGRSLCTRSGSPHASCGAKRPMHETRSTPNSGRTISSAPDSATHERRARYGRPAGHGSE